MLALFSTSLDLIPQWNTTQFKAPITFAGFFKTVFLTIPVLVFAFNHSPAISSFPAACRKDLTDDTEPHKPYSEAHHFHADGLHHAVRILLYTDSIYQSVRGVAYLNPSVMGAIAIGGFIVPHLLQAL